MPVQDIPVMAPNAILESHRSERPPLAAVFGPLDHGRDELLIVVDSLSGVAQIELYSGSFEAEGSGPAEIRFSNDHTCVAVAHLSLRGFDSHVERCELADVDIAVTWHIETGRIGHPLDVVGTALVYRSGAGATTRLHARAGHSFNRFEAGEPKLGSEAGLVAA